MSADLPVVVDASALAALAFGESQQLVAWMKRSGIRDRNLRFRVYKAPLSNRDTPPMVDAALLTRAKTMSPADRLELIGAVWGALSPADVPVTEEDEALLDVRLADLENNPQGQSPWPEVKARLKQNCLGLRVDKGIRRNALRLLRPTRAN